MVGRRQEPRLDYGVLRAPQHGDEVEEEVGHAFGQAAAARATFCCCCCCGSGLGGGGGWRRGRGGGGGGHYRRQQPRPLVLLIPNPSAGGGRGWRRPRLLVLGGRSCQDQELHLGSTAAANAASRRRRKRRRAVGCSLLQGRPRGRKGEWREEGAAPSVIWDMGQVHRIDDVSACVRAGREREEACRRHP